MHKNLFLLRQCKDEASKRILKNGSVSQNFRMSALRLPKVRECVIIKVWVLYAWGRQIIGASQVVLVVRNLSDNAGDIKRPRFDPWVGKMLWRRAWQPTIVFLPRSPMERGAWRAVAHRLRVGHVRLQCQYPGHKCVITTLSFSISSALLGHAVAAGGILTPQPGMEPAAPAEEARSLNHPDHQGSPPFLLFRLSLLSDDQEEQLGSSLWKEQE